MNSSKCYLYRYNNVSIEYGFNKKMRLTIKKEMKRETYRSKKSSSPEI